MLDKKQKVTCTCCGKTLLRGEPNSNVEVKCPSCKKLFNVIVANSGIVSISYVNPQKN